MSARTSPRPVEIALAIVIAAASALSTAVALAALAKPAHFESRLAQIRDDEASAKILLGRRSGETQAFDAACGSSVPDASEKLQRDLTALAASAHLGAPMVDVRPEGGAVGSGLDPLSVRFEATGPYDGALTLLSALTNLRPAIVLETMDLQAKTSIVTLNFKGRAYCSVQR